MMSRAVIIRMATRMIDQQKGHIVNMGSLCGLLGYPWQAAYVASKHAIVGLSEVLRYDLRRYNIGVSVICPGAVKTQMVKDAKIVIDDEGKIKKTRKSFSMVGMSSEYIAKRIIRAIETNKFMVVSPDLGWIWYLKRYVPPLYEGYQRLFCWIWNKRMK